MISALVLRFNRFRRWYWMRRGVEPVSILWIEVPTNSFDEDDDDGTK